MSASNTYLLYNTTFLLYRLSPFYTGSSLFFENTLLANYAQKFYDILTGESLRGVKMGLENENAILLRAGSLQKVTWSILQDENLLGTRMDEHIAAEGDSEKRGMLVSLSYENAEFRAIFLKDMNFNDSGVDNTKNGFHHFPLLLMKMPLSLRNSFTNFLATTFDTRVSSLFIGNKCMKDCFEKFIADISLHEFSNSDDDENTELNLNFDNIVKDIVVRIGFDLPNGSVSLKAIDIQILSEDLPRMITMGETTGHQRFFEAIKTYLKAHLALDINNPKVRITRISCAAFNLDSEGKFKLTQPSRLNENSAQLRANLTLIETLIKAAAGGSIFSLNAAY